LKTHRGPEVVEKIRSSVDIVSLISESVELKKSGRKYRGLCPFHNEKTPSFYVDETKQLFYCFGCGVGGDTFKYVMLQESLDFPGSLRMLARRAGISLPETGPSERGSEKEALLAACRAASALFKRILNDRPAGEPGRRYLEKRGLGAEVIDSLGLGFAPDRWDTLREGLVPQGHRPEILMAAGLLVRREGGGGFYDRFRNRIIFPIVNASGDVIGFGGRIIGDGEPKYLNSPETLVYNKRESLYGLYNSRRAIREAAEVIVVEGYLDFASLHQAGIRNVVATLGTSFTEEQASLLNRITVNVVLNYDADPAGESASKRSLEGLISRGLKVRILQLPDGRDPDAFVCAEGEAAYRQLLREAPSCFEFLVDSASRDRDFTDPASVADAAREIVPVLARVPSRIERSGYVSLLAERLNVEDTLLLAEIRDALMQDRRAASPAPRAGPAPARRAQVGEAEARLIQALVETESCRSRLLPEILPADLEDSPVASIVSRIAALDSEGRGVTYAELTSTLPDREREILAQIAMRGDPSPDEEEAAHCLETLRRGRLIRERNGIQKEMERTPDPARLDELMRKKIDLSRRIDSML
jgi:DNA primase